MARKANEIIHLKLRLPEALRRQLEKASAQNNRSMNSEIIQRLEQSFELNTADLIDQAVTIAVKTTIETLRREQALPPVQGGTMTLADLGKKQGDDK